MNYSGPSFRENETLTPARSGHIYEFLTSKESQESKAKKYFKFITRQLSQGYRIGPGSDHGIDHLIAGTNQNAFNTVE